MVANMKAKKMETYLHGTNIKVQCKVTELGYYKKLKVTAITDTAGPQVIVKGVKTHLLSRPLKDHAAAVKLGKQIVEKGINAYKNWYNLNKMDLAASLFALFGGAFRGTN